MITQRREINAMYADAVFAADGSIVLAYTADPGTHPRLFVEGPGKTFEEQPPQGIVQLRVATSPMGDICVVGPPADGPGTVVWVSWLGFIPVAAQCVGRPIVRWDRDAFDLVIPTDGTHHARVRISPTGGMTSAEGQHEATATGLSHFDLNGNPVIYPERGITVNGEWLGFPCVSGDVMVAQGGTGLKLVVPAGITTLDDCENPMEPHVDGNSARCVVTARKQPPFGPTLVLVCEPPYEVALPKIPFVRFKVEPAGPLAARGVIEEIRDVLTWRWIKDGVIDGGATPEHTFAFTTPGQHFVALRAYNPTGSIQTPDQPVEIEPIEPSVPKPVPLGYFALQTGMNAPSGPGLLAELKARGWQTVRYDVMRSAPAVIEAIVNETREAGLGVLLLCTTSQLGIMPEGVDVEPRVDIDTSKEGLEPNFTYDPKAFAAAINAQMPVARARGLKVWAGMVNTDGAALQWLTTVLATLAPDCGVSLHPYPLGGARGWYDRSSELAMVKRLIGDRPWIVGEWGWHQGPVPDPPRSVLQKILCAFGWTMPTHTHPSEEDIADRTAKDFAMWKAAGARCAVVYQIVDGPERCKQHPNMPANRLASYGIRTVEGRWKVIATVPTR